jgi:hypothetical protein
MNSIGNYNLGTAEGSTPYVVREGLFGATVNVNNEPLFLRMELLTENNTKNWARFKTMSSWVANQNANGVLSGLVAFAGNDNYPKYADIKEDTEFTEDEYTKFTEKAISLKKRTNDKIVKLLAANSVGIDQIYTGISSGERNFIVYVSKNPNFSIQNQSTDMAGFSLKNFINSYSDILISVGSDFSKEYSFASRGISRNPYWVFEEKYSGLSMLLHGFTGVVADKYFPKKTMMRVRPVGSMQAIIAKNLLPGEGYMERNGEKIDLTNIQVSAGDPEGGLNYIKIPALTRIYHDQVSTKTQ